MPEPLAGPSRETSAAEVNRLRPMPTRLEEHSGVVHGMAAAPRDLPVEADPRPRRALEDCLLRHLAGGECLVQFSGGRDSSLVLAVAVEVARRHGLPLPGAVSFRYPGDPGADEAQWQDRVVAHLGVDLDVVSISPGEDELVAPAPVSLLGRVGRAFPPAALADIARLSAIAAGRTVITGQGGDEILGPGRVSPFVAHWRHRRRPGRDWLRPMAVDLLPSGARRRLHHRDLERQGVASWLRPDVRDEVLTGLAADLAGQSWDWRVDRWNFGRRRMTSIGFASMARVARQERIELVHPLIEDGFVAALCAATDRWGFSNRTEVMRLLGGDLLPDDVLARRTKASFNEVYAGNRVRAFARRWTGNGVETDLVDVDRLRSAWTREVIPPASLSPLLLAVQGSLAEGWAPDAEAGS